MRAYKNVVINISPYSCNTKLLIKSQCSFYPVELTNDHYLAMFSHLHSLLCRSLYFPRLLSSLFSYNSWKKPGLTFLCLTLAKGVKHLNSYLGAPPASTRCWLVTFFIHKNVYLYKIHFCFIWIFLTNNTYTIAFSFSSPNMQQLPCWYFFYNSVWNKHKKCSVNSKFCYYFNPVSIKRVIF